MDDNGWRPESLGEARQRIDAIDSAILDLLHERARVVVEVGRLKRESGGTDAASAFRPSREVAMLRKLHTDTNAPLAFETVNAVWREIISGFTAAQMPLNITTPSETAALARNVFGAQAIVNIAANANDCLTAMRDIVGTIALVPATETDWDLIIDSGGKIVAATPFASTTIEAWCVTMASPEPSGDDVTLMVSTTLPTEAVSLGSCIKGHVIAVPGFHMNHPNAIGAYPIPLSTGSTTP